jgi:hypothetical protein
LINPLFLKHYGLHSKKYYPSKKEKAQFKRICEFCGAHGIFGEIWIKYPNRGWEIKRVEIYL